MTTVRPVRAAYVACAYCGREPCRRPVWDRLRRIADKRVLTNAMSPEAREEMELVLVIAEEETP